MAYSTKQKPIGPVTRRYLNNLRSELHEMSTTLESFVSRGTWSDSEDVGLNDAILNIYAREVRRGVPPETEPDLANNLDHCDHVALWYLEIYMRATTRDNERAAMQRLIRYGELCGRDVTFWR